MIGYLVHFIIYTMAMIGVIFGALYAFKFFANASMTKKSKMLNIEDTMNLSARKKLYVINVDGERFLIAGDMERTSLISKLGIKQNEPKPLREDKSATMKSFDGIESMSEFTSILDFNKKNSEKKPMMKELARKLNAV